MAFMTLRDLLDNHVVVLDGALSTQLEDLGVDTSNALWGALALDTDTAAITRVHTAYFDAGAHVATTNTYQATVPGFLAAGYDDAAATRLIGRGGELALAAAQHHRSSGHGAEALAAGSIGPYGAYLADGSEYTGNYDLSAEQYREFHRPRIVALHDAGVRTFAVETQPRVDEVLAVLDELAALPQAEAWVSFQLRDPATLADGTPLTDAVTRVDAWASAHPGVVAAVGINCVAPELVAPALQAMRPLTDLPLLCYPNSGDTYDPVSKTWQTAESHDRFTAHVPEWVGLGARMIGGCCRTTPSDIGEITRRLAPTTP